MKQQAFFSHLSKSCGGALNKNKRKQARTISTKQPIHLILKSHKKIVLSDEEQRNAIQICLYNYSTKFNIKLYSWSIQKDHIHILLRVFQRDDYKKFIRTFSAMLAREFGKGLWVLSPFTRLVEWGRDFKNVVAYIQQNEGEVQGLRTYKSR